MQAKMAGSLIEGLVKQVVSIGEINLLVSRVDEVDKAALRDLVDQLKVKFKNAVILLAKADDKVSLIAGVSKNITDKISAGKLVNHVAEQLGGKGGGRPDMAQAGAPNVEGLDQALKTVHDFVKAQV